MYAALAPCLMAATHCPDCGSAQQEVDQDCVGGARADCELSNPTRPSFDWLSSLQAPAPLLLVALPAAVALPADPGPGQYVKNAALRASPPLALRPAVLLI